MIHDYHALGEPTDQRCDVAIVGSGPAGLAIALELARTRLRGIVLETGGDAHEDDAEALSTFENVGRRRAPALAVRRRLFGGTSVVWTGRCTPFAATDFQARDWVPHSGWPIDRATLEPYLDRAGRLLGVGPAIYDDRVWALLDETMPTPAWDRSKFVTEVFQSSVRTHAAWRSVPAADPLDAGSLGALQHSGAPAAVDMGEVARPVLATSENVDVWLHAHVTEIVADADGRCARGVRIRRRDGSSATLHARVVVLACGGIDNARMLLVSGDRERGGLGNAHDQVGRYLTDHHYCTLGTIVGRPAAALRRRLSHRWFDRGRRFLYLTGLALAPQRQLEQHLLRGAVFPFEHVRQLAPISRLAAAARDLRRGERRLAAAAAGARALLRPFDLARDVADRFHHRRPALAQLDRLDIGCNVEQVPDPDSRVTLSERRDRFGQPLARVDWRIHDDEGRTYRACASLFAEECRRLRLDEPTLSPWLMDVGADWREHVHDMAHPMSSTRMSNDPRRGVVDANCRVHGVEGLFVAGSSVFTTGGTSNPTLTLTALAVRLADHLRAIHRSDGASIGAASAAPAIPATPTTPTLDQNRVADPVRIGFVGAGHRVRTIYAPVMRALSKSATVVGFTSRDASRGAAFAASTGWTHVASPAALVHEARAEALIVVVPGTSNTGVLHGVLGLGVPLLGETPIAWDERGARKLVARASAAGVVLGIAEQFPFLPREQLRQVLQRLGVLGAVTAVVNDFASYDYHGIAQLRAALGYGRSPVRASAVRFRFGRTGLVDGAPPAIPELGWEEEWLRGQVVHADGSVLIHDFSAGYAVSPTRPEGSIRVHGARGSEIGDAVILTDRRTGERESTTVRRETRDTDAGSILERLRVDVRGYGEIVWHNPFTEIPLDDEQIAVATLVDGWCRAVRYGGEAPYTAREALHDIEYLRALGYSADRGGAAVRMPLRATIELARSKVARKWSTLRRRLPFARD